MLVLVYVSQDSYLWGVEKNMNIKMIAVDLDGTLLNSDGKISSNSIQTIEKAIARGVKIIICSGRILKEARMFSRFIGSGDIIVACNGAIISDEKEGLYINEKLMDGQALKDLVDIMRKLNMYFAMYFEDTLVTEKYGIANMWHENTNAHLDEKDHIKIIIAQDIKQHIDNSCKSPCRVLIKESDNKKLQLIKEIVVDGEHLDIASHDGDHMEICARGVNKGRAVEAVAKHFGLDLSNVMAIGDNDNDIEMFKTVGIPVVMANARPEIKKFAKFITKTNNEDGAAYAIRKYCLCEAQ
jgi:Cof subfamily protein (haloacid dehalogenase superfamily)